MYRHAVVITPVARWILIARGSAYSSLSIHPQRQRPSPSLCRVGVHIGRFEACSTFTHVTACRLAASPKRYICLEGSDGFVSSTAAPIATGWSDPVAGWELHPLKTNTFPRRTKWLAPSSGPPPPAAPSSGPLLRLKSGWPPPPPPPSEEWLAPSSASKTNTFPRCTEWLAPPPAAPSSGPLLRLKSGWPPPPPPPSEEWLAPSSGQEWLAPSSGPLLLGPLLPLIRTRIGPFLGW